MQPIKITEMDKITNPQIIKEAKSLQSNQVILIFSDGTFTKVEDNYEGQLKYIDTEEVVTLNPINMNWRPLWVGIRLYNHDMRHISKELFQSVTYITHYIENDIIKNNCVNL